jgi:hypothetical protein
VQRQERLHPLDQEAFMAGWDLRPLSLGEILDRTFSIYRRNFLLFLGIAALPHLLVLALQLVQSMRLPIGVIAGRNPSIGNSLYAGGVLTIVAWIVQLFAYLFTQGGSVFAVSEIYLGRPITIGESFGRMRGELGNLFVVLLLNSLLVFGAPVLCFVGAIASGTPSLMFFGFVLFMYPGIYLACRLMVCVPCALLENIGPRASLERSFSLTKGSAGRAFVVYLLYVLLIWAAASLLTWPFAAGIVASQKDPTMLRIWLALTQVGSFIAEVLVGPFLTIAAAIFYFDLRVRKEAFDLQILMNPSGNFPSGPASVPTMLS